MASTSIDTLIDDVYALLDPEVDHVPSEANLDALGEAVKDAMRVALAKYEKKGDLRFSGIGKQSRQIWYDKHADPADAEQMTPNTYIKFLYGHLIEAMLVFLVKESGHEVSGEQEEVEVDGVKGHMDIIIDGHVVDIKSASPYSYKKFADGELQPNDDAFGYIQQLSGYATCKGLPAAFLVADKVTGHLVVSPLSQYAIKAHPPKDRIKELKDVLANDNPPPKCYTPKPDGKSGNMQLGVGCSYCKWKFKCWSDANQGKGLRTFIYSTGPRFLTNVAREPDVYEAKRNAGAEVQEQV